MDNVPEDLDLLDKGFLFCSEFEVEDQKVDVKGASRNFEPNKPVQRMNLQLIHPA